MFDEANFPRRHAQSIVGWEQAVSDGTKLSRSLEDYLETVAELVARDGVARTRDVARRLNVAPSSVNSAVNKLADRGLVTHKPYEFIRLTKRGEELGGAIRRRHELLCSFLTDVLGVPPEAATTDACKIEHGLSSTTVARLVEFMDFINRCPDGKPEWLEQFHAASRSRGRAARDGSDRGAGIRRARS